MFKQYLSIEDSGRSLTRTLEQVERPLILDTLAEARKAQPMADRPGLGRWALSVPTEDYMRLVAKYPDLASKDAQIKSRAWRRFIQSGEAGPYKVRERV